MKESPEEIRREVEQAHARLTQDLNALEYRVKNVTDWRWQFQRHPWPILGAAFGAALLLGLLTGRNFESRR
jgi:hypothetical protein